jgi:hypothetical protein
MKKLLLSLFIIFCSVFSYSQNVGIGTNTPHASAALEIKDTSKGILIPRMTMAQRNTIQNPTEGLMVYQTDSTKGFWYWDGSGWISVSNINSIQTVNGDIRRLQNQLYLRKD